MTEAGQQQIAERLQFLNLSDDDRARLRGFLPVARQAMPEILRAFYSHMRGYPDLVAMFKTGQPSMDRASSAQSRHWETLFSGQFDAAYMDSARRIGRMHSRIGLEPRYYIGGYSHTLSYLYALAIETHASRFSPLSGAREAGRLVAALSKAVLLDMDLVISIYLEENAAAYQHKLQALTQTFEADVGSVADRLAAQAATMTASATSMRETAQQAAGRAQQVATGAEEASANVQTVASATEELHASVGEISRQVTQSNEITGQAVQAAESTNAAVQELGVAAQKIGDVVSLISTIAGQTNLLALNATIEAARAGDAGKGFAVVASEVKGLAGQTAKATESITAQVHAMQSATATAIKAIEGIVSTIGTLNQIAGTIAAAVEQQGAATQEIARNVQSVARATELVSGNINAVSGAVGGTESAASATLESAQGLGEQADQLRANVGGFLAKVRAA